MIPANAALGLAWRAVALASPLLLACAAAAQPRVLDLNVLALDWARGRYLSPVICETDGELVRGGRRLLITPGPRHARPPTDRILFSDLELGQLEFRHLARARPDTAQRDFKAALRRDRGFEFAIARGTLRIQPVGSDEPRDVDFGGGEARLHAIAPGSDDARLLGDLIGLRKLVLELESPDGTLLRLPLLMTELR
jgi:hypothetical protein